jgi:hypothetical protein
MKMRAWWMAAALAGAWVAAACAAQDDGDAAGALASSVAGGPPCDSGQSGDSGSPICASCLACAAKTPACAALVATCQGPSGACRDFRVCRDECAGQCDANHDGSIKGAGEYTCFNACVGDESHSGPTTCMRRLPAGAALWQQQVECPYAACPDNCGDAVFPVCDSAMQSVPGCAACLGGKCCAEFKACGDDSKCAECIGNVGKSKSACDASTLDETALGCMASKCGSVCLTSG